MLLLESDLMLRMMDGLSTAGLSATSLRSLTVPGANGLNWLFLLGAPKKFPIRLIPELNGYQATTFCRPRIRRSSAHQIDFKLLQPQTLMQASIKPEGAMQSMVTRETTTGKPCLHCRSLPGKANWTWCCMCPGCSYVFCRTACAPSPQGNEVCGSGGIPCAEWPQAYMHASALARAFCAAAWFEAP